MTVPRLRILHETNPEKYFPALYLLAQRGDIHLVGEHRYSVIKEWFRAWLRDRTRFFRRSRNSWHDLRFRLSLRRRQGEIIVFGFAPWDWRLLLYRGLARHNRILYQTSWHDWRLDHTPRQPQPALVKRWLRQQWLTFLEHPAVTVVAVTPVVAETVLAETRQRAQVIPHAVPKLFFDAGAARGPRVEGSLRLIFVGEVSEKKGIKVLLRVMQELAPLGVTLTVVGDGPEVGSVRAAGSAVHFFGPTRDRARLAEIMAGHDALVLLSQRTTSWEELFGIVVVEALAAGLAVVASDHVGPRGVLSPIGGAGLFDEADYAGVLTSLRVMAENPDRAHDLWQAQFAVTQNYAIDMVAARWMAVIGDD